LSDRELAASPLLPCHIQLARVFDDSHGTQVTVASAHAPDSQVAAHLVPDLFEPELSTLSNQGLRLDGYEKIAVPGKDQPERCPQSWLVIFRR